MSENEVEKPKLKIGFLIDPCLIEQCHIELMDSVQNNPQFFNPPYFIELSKEHVKQNKFPILSNERIISGLAYVIKKIELSRVRKNPKYDDYFLTHISSDIHRIRPNFTQSSLEQLNPQQFDLFIDCTDFQIPDYIYKYSKYGVIQSFIDKCSLNNKLFLGFLDVLNKNPSSAITISCKQNNSREHSLIYEGKIMTKHLWHSNRAALIKKSNAFILHILKNFNRNNNFFMQPNISMDASNITKEITISKIIKYILEVYGELIFCSLRRILKISQRHKRWSIAYLKGNSFNKDFGSANEVKNLPGRFFADPFVITHKNRTICFVEDFFFSEAKGKISAIEIFDQGYKFLDIVLEENFHLSFPFVFIHEDKVYMIPETNEANEIRLYQAVDFPLKWKLHQVLMQNISAVDTIIFRDNSIWYMLTNICSSCSDDHSSELHIFYSDKFNSANWRPIKSHNPVIFDSQLARNGGFFELDANKYRVNQVQGFSHYGKSFAVNLIKNISKETYEEEHVFDVQPDFREDIISTHHYHTNGKFIVFDYCKNEKII